MTKSKITPFDVEPLKFNKALAEKIKIMPEFEIPAWATFVKTGKNKERPPADSDWWYNRAGSILRQVYKKGVIGVERLKTKYGSRQNRGMKPEKFAKASGKIIRTILQQAEKAEFIEKVKDQKAGRKLTKKGLEFLEKTAQENI